MKTTIELPDALFAQARRFAQAHDMTMKAMVEEGLRKVMAAKKPAKPFKLRDASFDGGSVRRRDKGFRGFTGAAEQHASGDERRACQRHFAG